MWLLGLAACWEIEEQLRLRRVWEMQDHEADAIAARDALARGDVEVARSAARRLAERDVVPGVPEAAVPYLVAVRAGGSALAVETDRAAAAATLVGITADCAGCHRALGISAPLPFVRDGVELAWTGLVFESEQRWAEGLAALGPEGEDLACADSWDERRAAFARRLGPPVTLAAACARQAP